MSKAVKSAPMTAARIVTTAGVSLVLAGLGAGAAQAGTKIGWIWADQPDAVGTYTPSTFYSYNSSGGAISVTPEGVGVYRVSFEGLKTSQATNVIATAYGTNGYCTVSNWSPDGGSFEGVTVNCFDAHGVPANAYFTLLYQSHAGTFGSGNKGTAYLWADQENNNSYTPNLLYQFNSTGATNTITRWDTGSYTVLLPGFDKVGGHVQVTAYGSDAARCKVAPWGVSVGSTAADVLCFDSDGAPVNHKFTLAYSRAQPIGWEASVATVGAYGWASEKKRLNYKLPGAYQFNGFGTGKLTETRHSKGNYTVTIPGPRSYESSNMLVTAVGYGNEYCTIIGWEPLDVGCYAQGGHVIDATFGVDFQVSGTVLGPQH